MHSIERPFSPAYAASSEMLFDNALAAGRFDRAKESIDNYVTALELLKGDPSVLFRARLKQAALPLYFRVAEDAGLDVPYDQEMDVSSVYGELSTLLEEQQSRENITKGTGAHFKTIGDSAELLFFALLARPLVGDGSDQYTIIPASRIDDIGERTATNEKTGVDFRLFSRHPDMGNIPIQVKSSSAAVARSTYAPGIFVVNMGDISAHQPRGLRSAFLNELRGAATANDRAHIETAYSRFNERYQSFLEEAPEQQI